MDTCRQVANPSDPVARRRDSTTVVVDRKIDQVTGVEVSPGRAEVHVQCCRTIEHRRPVEQQPGPGPLEPGRLPGVVEVDAGQQADERAPPQQSLDVMCPDARG